ncbi:MAG: TadE/TadG family type IV pilus assembly protein [Steroidobacteraceae bacterium]
MSSCRLSRTRSQRRPQSVARQHGVAMVEFVIGAPILLFLFYCVVEFGEILLQMSVLADAARSADRYLARNALLGSTGVVNLSGALITATQNLAVYGNANGFGAPLLTNLTPADVAVSVNGANNVSVNIAYHYDSLFGGVIPLFYTAGSINTGDLSLNAYSSMLPL